MLYYLGNFILINFIKGHLMHLKKPAYLITASILIVATVAIIILSKNEKIIGSIVTQKDQPLAEVAKNVAWRTANSIDALNDLTISDELSFQQITKDILIPLQSEILEHKKSDFSPLFIKKEEKVFGIDVNPVELVDEIDDIKRFSWSESQAQTSLKKYVTAFSKVEDFRIDILSYNVNMPDRSRETSKANKMTVTGFVDLRGQATSGLRRHDSGKIQLVLENLRGEWKIDYVVLKEMNSLISARSPAFTEITKNVFGNNGPSSYLRREAIRRGGYALSLTDVNKDGFLDIYVGSQKESQLLIFNKTTAGYEIDPKSIGPLSSEKMVKTAVFNDLDNDGDEDLFITSFNPVHDASGLTEDLTIYENNGGVLKKLGDPTRGMKRKRSFYPMPAAVADFNNDGLMDMYVGFPGKKDFTFTNLNDSKVIGGNPSVQGLFLNKGSLAFNESILSPQLTMEQGQRQNLYPHSALSIDWNKDHNMDIVVIDDQDNLSPFYTNKGKAVFEQVAEKIGIRDTDNGMSIAAGDYNNDGLIDFAMTSVNLNAAKRYENAMANMWHRSDITHSTGVGGNGLRLFQQNKNGTFTETTKAAGLVNIGEGSAGLEFIDYNNDGYADIYVTNGLWSGNDRLQDAGYLLLNHKLKVPHTDDMLKDRPEATTSSFMSMLIDFKGDLFGPKFLGNKSLSLGGYQRNHLFRNNRNGTFTDVGYIENADSINDGYVVATADLDNDGKNDLILRNGDPAQADHMFPAVQIFHNTLKAGNSINLALKNKNGVDAIGVGVTIEIQGLKQYKQLISNNGAAQSERRIQFGIGNSKTIDKLTIHWSSGDKTFRNVKFGNHEYLELHEALSQI